MKNSRETPSKKSILGYFAKYPKILYEVSLLSFFGQEKWMLHEDGFRVKRKVSESVCLLRLEKYNYC